MNKRSFGIFFGMLLTLTVIIIFRNRANFIALVSPNSLSLASKVRDRDELRLAEANSQIGQWSLKHQLPLDVNGMFDFKGIKNFLITVITSNRGYRKIDEFEPYYLTQTFIALIKELIATSKNTSSNVGRVKFLICATDASNITDTYSKELNRLIRILGNGTIASPPRNSDALCKHTLDMKSCLSLGMKLHPESDAIVLLEDDFLVTNHFLPVLNLYSNHPGYNVLKLYTNFRSAFLVTVNLYTLFLLLCLFVSVIFFCVFRKKGLRCMVTVIALVSIVLLTKECNQQESLIISPSKDHEFTPLGAAAILPKSLARKVSENIHKKDCDWPKGKYISKAASDLAYNILNVHPPAAIHIGMYSQTRDYIYDPNLFLS